VRRPYVCSKCGGPNVHLDESRTTIDPRYPIGHCDRCTPEPKPRIKKGTGPGTTREAVWVTSARRTVPLLRADLDDPADREHRAKLARMRELAARLHPTTAAQRRKRYSEAELKEASAAVAWLRRAE
jgi:hypothetical protein